VSAVGPGRIHVRATGRRGSFRARLVFPKAGQWRISAQAGGATSRLGSVRVRRPPARPVVFAQPTSIDLEPAGTLLLVESNPGRVLRVDPATGRVSVLVPSIAGPYAVVRAPSGSLYVSVGNELQRLNGGGPPSNVAEVPAGVEIGPIAAGPNGASTTRPRRRSSGSREVRGRPSGSPAPGKQVEAVTAVRP
jgi:streptogramin lyase